MAAATERTEADPATRDVLVRVRGASFGYGGDPILAGVDLEVRERDLVGIVGPNGSGKTTLLRGIAGLIGHRGTVERAPDATIGYVPQRETLDPLFPLTVEEVVRMGAFGRLRGLRRLGVDERRAAGAALERVGLAGRARESFADLSGGQRQRALIARALVVRPRLLLLDEPTSGVDEGTSARILGLLEGLRSERGIAVLLVSHQLAMLREAVPEVLFVDRKRVVRGSSADLLDPERILGWGA